MKNVLSKFQASSYVLLASVIGIVLALAACPMPSPNMDLPDRQAPAPITEAIQLGSGRTISNNARDISPSLRELSIAFNEAIQAVESASAPIVLRVSASAGTATGANSEPQEFNVNNEEQVRIQTTFLTLLGVELTMGTSYEVAIPEGVIEDSTGNDIARTTLNFATAMTTNSAPSTPTILGGRPLMASENISDSTPIGVITASDPDAGDTISYEITDSSVFEIDETTGVISLVNGQSLDFDSLSASSNPISITVQVSDSATPPLTSSAQFNITIINANEAPQFSSPEYRESIPEGIDSTAIIAKVSVNDPENDTITYSIIAPANSIFEISDSETETENSAVITLVEGQDLDYEIRDSYTIMVQAEDMNGLNAIATVLITVTNENEAPNTPTIVGDSPLMAIENISDTVVIGTITASDPDAGDIISYEIIDSNLFEIDESTGEISLADGQTLDLESLSDSTESITVQVSDSGTPPLTSSAPFSIMIVEENEAPVFTSSEYILFVAEDFPDPMSPVPMIPNPAEDPLDPTDDLIPAPYLRRIFGGVLATDPDSDTITYSIISPIDTPFEFYSPMPGQLPMPGALQLAAGQSLNYAFADSYSLSVQADDGEGQTALATVTIMVIPTTPINLAPTTPTLQGGGTSLIAIEGISDTDVIGTVIATDPNIGDTIRYSILNTTSIFEIDSASGEISLATGESIDATTEPNSHEISVLAVDSAATPLTSFAVFTITETRVDADGDGLIDIHNLEMLSNTRWNTEGTSYMESRTAMGLTSGCPEVAGTATCNGYELMSDLDFDSDGDGRTWTENADGSYTLDSDDDNDIYFDIDAGGWDPIVVASTFEGNGFTIRNLAVNRTGRNVGLFDVTPTGFTAEIRNLHLEQALVIGNSNTSTGGLIGGNLGGLTITGSSLSDSIIIATGNSSNVGGFVGLSSTNLSITGSSAGASISATGNSSNVGGLVGGNFATLSITGSYSSGSVSANARATSVGGLVGANNRTASINITGSYSNASLSATGAFALAGGIVGFNNDDSTSLTVTASYSSYNTSLFGSPAASMTITESYKPLRPLVPGSIFIEDPRPLPAGVDTLAELSATNVGTTWNNTANNTAGVWAFGQRVVGGGPSLRFADYDGTGNGFHCEGTTAGAPTSVEIPNCGDQLPGQDYLPGQL